MRWTETAPAKLPCNDLDIDSFCNQQNASKFQAAAVAYAETAMGRSLMQRTLTAIFYANVLPRDPLYLPRGPVISVTSVVDVNGRTLSPSEYLVEYSGNAARLRIGWAYTYPLDLTVTYEAGYGYGTDQFPGKNIPADIVHAIKMHCSYLNMNREGDAKPPEHLDAFYNQRSWEGGIG